jgi:hypothetical protein
MESRPGMTMTSPQEGQLISVPAPELSTANSWSHLGQLNMTSITGAFRFDAASIQTAPRREKQKVSSFQRRAQTRWRDQQMFLQAN